MSESGNGNKSRDGTMWVHIVHVKCVIFSSRTETPGVSEDIRPFWEYYTAADADLQTFLTVRQHWDSYIVPDGSAGGSSVPLGWVTPTAPSDPTWESALKHYGGKT